MSTNKVHEYHLNNGFRLIVKEDHRSPSAIFQLVYKVGSSYECNGITGISHVLEHMMFRGTKHHSAKSYLKQMAESGAHQNAFTGHDYTAYFQILNATYLPDSFKFEADRMCNLLLTERDYSKEIQIVMEERRLTVEDDPQRNTLERFNATAYISSPYQHPIIGWMDDLKNMTIDDLRSWYRLWYAPNNAIGIVVGDVKPEAMHQLAKKYFGKLKPSILPKIKPPYAISTFGMRSVSFKMIAKLPWLVMGYNTPVLKTADEKWKPYALLVLCEILAGGKSARLQQALVRRKQIALDVNYHYSPFLRFNGVLRLYATPRPGHTIEELKRGIFLEIRKITNNLPYSNELNRVKIQTIATKIYQQDSIAHQAQEIGNLEAVGLSWREIDNAYKIIAAITPEQIQKVAREYLIEDRLIMADLQPLPIETRSNQ